MPRSRPKQLDPAEVANKKILAGIEERRFEKEAAESLDLGLKLKEVPATTAAELLHDQWDKEAYGDKIKTTTRVIYGPDPIVNNCPAFHERLEKFGLEAVAEAFCELIMQKGEFAAPDPIMSKGIRLSIARFGKDATAKAFRDRVLQIPSRTVEIELDSALDPFLSNPMREAVAQYGQPGMAVKFLSERCMTVLGMRGYEIVKKLNGDPVKIGTLFMGHLPEAMAERRRQHWAAESIALLTEQEQAYYEVAAREIRDGRGSGISTLEPGDTFTAKPTVNDEYTGESRTIGINRAV